MADIYYFFEEGIKSYIDQSFKKDTKNELFIINKNYDNNLLQPIFINDISLYKNLIQKNKLKSEIWLLILEKMEQKISEVLSDFNISIEKINKNICLAENKIKKSYSLLEQYKKEKKEIKQEVNNYSELNKKQNNDNDDENIINQEEKNNNDLTDVKCPKYYSKLIGDLINKLTSYKKKKIDETVNISQYESELETNKRNLNCLNINILKLKMLQLTTKILINEMNIENKNNNFDKEKNYKLLNEFLYDFVDRCEKIKESLYIDYTSFIKAFVIKLVLIINKQGYKDINKHFLNQLLNAIDKIKKHYSNSNIYSLIKYIEKIKSSPDIYLCPNAFEVLKKASFKTVKPRSRNNSFDKNDPIYNSNNKNEKNRKIDEFIKIEEKESDSDSEDFQKKLSNVISFKHSSTQLNNLNNNMYNPNSMNSAISNNSNLLDSSKISLDDSLSIQGSMYRSGSYSELLGINSRLASQLPCVRNTKKEKENKYLEKFKKKIRIKKEHKYDNNFNRKNSNEKLDNIFGKEIRKIVNNNFYNNNANTYDNKDKNTTATENKKNNNENDISKYNKNSNILATKTPIKNGSENAYENNNKIVNINNLKDNDIKKNLQLLFNQQTDKL